MRGGGGKARHHAYAVHASHAFVFAPTLAASLCLLALVQPDGATKVLIGWAIAQPVMYAQLANVEFVAESLSMVGGLLVLRAHLSEQAEREGRQEVVIS